DHLEEDPRDEREGEVAVRDGRAEGRLLAGALAIDVDPLVVAGGVGELEDGLVGHGPPGGGAQRFAHQRFQARTAIDKGLVGHAPSHITGATGGPSAKRRGDPTGASSDSVVRRRGSQWTTTTST